MQLSVMYELFTPQPMDVDAEHRIIQQTLDQIELADKLGFRAAWAVEHHFLEEYAHSSAPEVLLAAASQRTTRIRLGHGIVNTVPAINHPFRVAERVSTLDHVSKGRVEFGSGEGASAVELGGFGVDPDQKNAMWAEGLDFVIKAMTERPFALRGRVLVRWGSTLWIHRSQLSGCSITTRFSSGKRLPSALPLIRRSR